MRREWIHFLPEDWGQSPIDLAHLVNFVSLHASEEKFRDEILLSIKLLERLNGIDDERHETVVGVDRPWLWPLIVNFAKRSLLDEVPKEGGDWNLLVSEWAPIRDALSEVPPLDLTNLPLPCRSPISPNALTSLIGGNTGIAPIPCAEGNDASFAEFYDNYIRQFDHRNGHLKEALVGILNKAPVPRVLFGDDTCKNAIAHWLRGDGITDKLLKYIIWLHDLSPRKPWSQVITIPVWLPEQFPGFETISMVLYVRDNEWFGDDSFSETSRPLQDLASCIAAFRSGSQIAAEQAGEDSGWRYGRAEQSQFVAHELDWVSAALMADLKTLPEKAAAAAVYVELWRRWMRGELSLAMPTTLNSYFLPEFQYRDLFKLTAMGGYFRAERRSGVPDRVATGSATVKWTCDQLWLKRNKWITWRCTLPKSLHDDPPTDAEIKAWLLSFCVTAHYYSICYAFRDIPVFSNWQTAGKHVRRAHVIVDYVERNNRTTITISNKADRLGDGQSVSSVFTPEHSQQLISKFSNPESVLFVEDFRRGDTPNPDGSYWWRARIHVRQKETTWRKKE
jgi:hypothetical protein